MLFQCFWGCIHIQYIVFTVIIPSVVSCGLCISLRGINFHEAMYIGTIIVTGKYIHVVAYAAAHNQELLPSEEMFNNLKLFSWDSQVVKVTAPSL